jgi:hypothetical protein
MGDDGGCAMFGAYERLDFFKLLSPPVSRDPLFILCADITVAFLQAVSETGCRPILPLPISKCKGVEGLKSWAKRSPRHFILDSACLMHAAFLKPVARGPAGLVVGTGRSMSRTIQLPGGERDIDRTILSPWALI